MAQAAGLIRVNAVGVDYRHPESFEIRRDQGGGDWLLLHFLVPVQARTTQGIHAAPRGSCLLYPPGQPQWYRGDGIGLANDWLHFSGVGRRGNGDVRRLLRRLRLPVGVPFQPAHAGDVPVLLSEIRREYVRRDTHWQEVCDTIVRRLFLLLSRSAQPHTPAMTPHQRTLHEACQQVRLRVQAAPQERWTLERMARLAHLSRSRFATVFTRFFGVSPMEYVIQARIDHARWYLANTDLPVKRIAALSGFSSIHYFSRAFRKRVGCPPSRLHTAGR